MPTYDFAVDPTLLATAASRIDQAVATAQADDIGDLMPSASAVASPELTAALAEFADRWDRGVTVLVRDTAEIAARLAAVAQTYAEFDTAGRDTALASSLPGNLNEE